MQGPHVHSLALDADVEDVRFQEALHGQDIRDTGQENQDIALGEVRIAATQEEGQKGCFFCPPIRPSEGECGQWTAAAAAAAKGRGGAIERVAKRGGGKAKRAGLNLCVCVCVKCTNAPTPLPRVWSVRSRARWPGKWTAREQGRRTERRHEDRRGRARKREGERESGPERRGGDSAGRGWGREMKGA